MQGSIKHAQRLLRLKQATGIRYRRVPHWKKGWSVHKGPGISKRPDMKSSQASSADRSRSLQPWRNQALNYTMKWKRPQLCMNGIRK